MSAAVILPSRNEEATITAVTTAVDAALDDPEAVIILADSSDTPATAERFAATPARAQKLTLTKLPRGKGAQILAAARHLTLPGTTAVLIADTDTRNPSPAIYRALLDRVRAGAGLAIADYPRFWDEANLTVHLARPLIAAATGHDIPQPLAGDIAMTGAALAAARAAADTLDTAMAACVAGYGIDVFLLLTTTAAARAPVVPLRFTEPKHHAGSFPHLPRIYQEAVPVLLHLAAARNPPAPGSPGRATYRACDHAVPPDRLAAMLTALEHLAPAEPGCDYRPWPLTVVDAWHAVSSGASAPDAARQMWPHYIHRVRAWLTCAAGASPGQRADMLAAAHARLTAALASRRSPR